MIETKKRIKEMLLNSKDKFGNNIFDHLTELYLKMRNSKNEWNYENFEELSGFVKMTRMPTGKISHIQDNQIPISFLNLALNHLNNITNGKLKYIQDVVSDMKMLEWVGVYIGEEESFLINISLNKICIHTKPKAARFWGKIFGTQKDYYIIETSASIEDNFEPEKGQENRGKGINSNIYWVTNNLLEKWTQLPDARPEYIIASKKIKKYLSGNLNSTIKAYPFFEGKEKDLLRSVISRITHSTTIVPNGIYEVSSDNDREIVFKEEITVPTMEELNAPENWQHLYSNILLAGRTEHLKPEKKSEEEDPDELLERLKESDPYIERLKAINEDEPFPKYETGWQVKSYGDNQQYAQPPPKEINQGYNAISLQPYRWPGALTVVQKCKYCTIYIGNGIKAGGLVFIPLGPDQIQRDVDGLDEQPEVINNIAHTFESSRRTFRIRHGCNSRKEGRRE